MELKKLQTPLYEEFFNSLNTPCSPALGESKCDETAPSYLRLPPKSRSPSRAAAGTSTTATDGVGSGSPGSNNSRRISNVGNASNQSSPDVGLPQSSDLKGLANGGLQDSSSPRLVSLESILSLNKFIYVYLFVSYSVIVLTSLIFIAMLASLRDERYGKKNLTKSLRQNEVDFLFPVLLVSSLFSFINSFVVFLQILVLCNICSIKYN